MKTISSILLVLLLCGCGSRRETGFQVLQSTPKHYWAVFTFGFCGTAGMDVYVSGIPQPMMLLTNFLSTDFAKTNDIQKAVFVNLIPIQ